MKKVCPYMSASPYLVKLVSPNRGTFKSKIVSRLRAEPEPKVVVCGTSFKRDVLPAHHKTNFPFKYVVLNEIFFQVSFIRKLPSGENRSTIDPRMTATVMYASHLANGI